MHKIIPFSSFLSFGMCFLRGSCALFSYTFHWRNQSLAFDDNHFFGTTTSVPSSWRIHPESPPNDCRLSGYMRWFEMQRELFQNVWVEKGWKRSIANPYSKECVKGRGMLVLLSSALFFYGRPRQGHEWTQKLGKAGARGALLVRTRPQRGGGGGASTDPKIVARNKVLCRRRRRRRFCFRHTAGGIFLVPPYVSILNILRILWRIQKWLKSTKKVM